MSPCLVFFRSQTSMRASCLASVEYNLYGYLRINTIKVSAMYWQLDFVYGEFEPKTERSFSFVYSVNAFLVGANHFIEQLIKKIMISVKSIKPTSRYAISVLPQNAAFSWNETVQKRPVESFFLLFSDKKRSELLQTLPMLHTIRLVHMSFVSRLK